MANFGKIKGVGIHIIGMFLVLSICFYYLFYMYLPSITNHGETITVPNLIGMQVSDVEKAISKNSLLYKVVDSTAFNPNAEPSAVLNQVPRANAKVKENRKIYLTINAKNAPNVEMPNLVNKSLRDALILLESIGFKKDSIVYKPYIFENVVIGQLHNGEKIKESKLLPKGSKISLIVGMGSKGNEIAVPDLIGRSHKGLKEYLEGYGLMLSPLNWKENSDMSPGRVFKQSPMPSDSTSSDNKMVKFGSIIDVWISGKQPVKSDTTSTK